MSFSTNDCRLYKHIYTYECEKYRLALKCVFVGLYITVEKTWHGVTTVSVFLFVEVHKDEWTSRWQCSAATESTSLKVLSCFSPVLQRNHIRSQWQQKQPIQNNPSRILTKACICRLLFISPSVLLTHLSFTIDFTPGHKHPLCSGSVLTPGMTTLQFENHWLPSK